jgi:hypothetical protein
MTSLAGTGYNLQACHKALPVQSWLDNDVIAVGWGDAVKSLGYTLYDADRNRFI